MNKRMNELMNESISQSFYSIIHTAWKDVVPAISKLRRRQSMRINFEETGSDFSFFEEIPPAPNNKKKNNKISSSIRAVPDPTMNNVFFNVDRIFEWDYYKSELNSNIPSDILATHCKKNLKFNIGCGTTSLANICENFCLFALLVKLV